MIEINLLPEEAKKKKRSPARMDISAISAPGGIPIVNIAAWAAAAVLVIQLILFAVEIIGGATFRSLTLEHKNILPKKQETEKLKARVDTINKKVAAIDELMVKRFSWEKKLNALSDAMIPGIWLTELEYDEKFTGVPIPVNADPSRKPGQAAESGLSRYLILSGAASSMGEEGTALIGRFIKSLNDDPAFYSDFRDIELGTIKREKIGEQEVMTFKITCFFKAR